MVCTWGRPRKNFVLKNCMKAFVPKKNPCWIRFRSEQFANFAALSRFGVSSPKKLCHYNQQCH